MSNFVSIALVALVSPWAFALPPEEVVHSYPFIFIGTPVKPSIEVVPGEGGEPPDYTGHLKVRKPLVGHPPADLKVVWDAPVESSKERLWFIRKTDGTHYYAVSLATSEAPKYEAAIRQSAFDATLETCNKEGGAVKPVGKAAVKRCVVPFADGGQTCKDSSDCIAGCFFVGISLPKPGISATGTCRPDTNPYGCFTEIKSGKTSDSMCKD